MSGIVDKIKLEKLLITRWSEFINGRTLLNSVRTMAKENLQLGSSCKVQNVKFSRFEPKSSYFIVWLELSILLESEPVNVTLEAELDLLGNLRYRQHC